MERKAADQRNAQRLRQGRYPRSACGPQQRLPAGELLVVADTNNGRGREEPDSQDKHLVPLCKWL